MPIPDLVALVHSAMGASETEELEWKLEFPLGSRSRRAELAKHVIAFGNRDPDRAARTFQGHAFLLIGVEPGTWGTAPELDPAEIVGALEPYIGSELSWHPVYAEYEDHRVLVIVVDPPRWGDQIHRFARGAEDAASGKGIKAGTAFVRLPGVSRPAQEADLRRLEERAATPRPHLRVANDWNLGARGDYIGVNVANGPDGRFAVLHEVGFTMAGAAEVNELPSEANVSTETQSGRAYVSLPVEAGDKRIEPGETLRFRVPLGALPWCWDESTEIFPYVYFDQGHWLVGKPTELVGQLCDHGWQPSKEAPQMFSELALNYVAPKAVSGLRARLRLGPDTEI
ncbi:MAG: hypothetical protein JWO14_2965 [Solirubrobacterales bacterium]|nr:hypothetical protein [Solirubrobacterales bacterium]